MDFDWGYIGWLVGLFMPIIFFLVFYVLFRKRTEQVRRVRVLMILVSEIEHNQKLMESFTVRSRIKKYITGNWDRNQDEIKYIMEDKGLYSTLVYAYEIIKEFNREIDKAKKNKSTSYLVGIKVERLREPLERSKQGLKEWLELNKGKKQVSTRAP